MSLLKEVNNLAHLEIFKASIDTDNFDGPEKVINIAG